MQAMLTKFVLGPGTTETANKLAAQWAPLLKSMNGFQSATFMGDPDAGEYTGLTLWDSMENAEAAMASTESQFQEQIGSIAIEPPTRKIYNVWSVI